MCLGPYIVPGVRDQTDLVEWAEPGIQVVSQWLRQKMIPVNPDDAWTYSPLWISSIVKLPGLHATSHLASHGVRK